MASLAAVNLGFSIRGEDILSKVSLRLEAGGYLGLIGPNGSGKSTLLRILAGQLRPSTGSVSVDGRDIFSMSVRERARQIAYMPQIVSAENLRSFTVRETVLMGRFPFYGRLRGPSAADSALADAAMEEMGLADMAGRDVASLSGGEFQKVLLAGVIAQDTKIILLDESFSFLDIRHRIDLERRLKNLLARGRSIIYVFHQFDESLYAKTDILALKEGRVFYSGPVRGFLEKGRPDRLFDIAFKKVSVGKRSILLPDVSP